MNKKMMQRKLLRQLKGEIDDLERKIKHYNFNNKKIKMVKNLKISARALQMVAPYVLTGGIFSGILIPFGITPIYRDDEKNYAKTMTETDNTGNVRIEHTYDYFSNMNNVINYYSKWEKENDGFYSRNMKTYSVSKKSDEEIMELLEKEDLVLEDILGKPIKDSLEKRNNLSEEEIQEEEMIEAIIYDVDKNDYIMVKESIADNIIETVAFFIVLLWAERIPANYRLKKSSFNFMDCVEKIKVEYQPLNIDDLKKQLVLKRDNYDRLMRK